VLGGGGSSTGGTYTASSGAAVDLAGTATSVFTGTYTGSGAGTVELAQGGAIAVGTSGATLNFPAGLFQMPSGSFDLVGNTLTNAGTISLTNASGTTDGVFANNFFSGGNSFNLGGTFANTGTIVEQGVGGLKLYDNVILSNQGTYQFAGDGSILLGSAAPNSVVNTAAGTVTKTAGTGTSAINIPFDNQGGTVDAESGTISLADGGTSTGGTYNANGTGVVNLTGGSSPTFTGSYTGSGSGQVRLASGTLNIGSAGATFNFVSGLFAWSGGTLAGPGTLTNASSGYLTVSGGTLSGTLSNQGTITQPGGTLTISGTLSNTNMYNVALAASGTATAGSGTLTNTGSGTLELTTAVTATLTGKVANQGGTINAAAGTLVLDGGGTSTGGNYDASTGATLDLTGGQHDNSATPVWTGTYTGTGGGTVLLAGEIAVGAAGATFNFPAGLFQWTGYGIDLDGHTATNNGAITASGATSVAIWANNFFTGGNSFNLGGTFNNAGTVLEQNADGVLLYDGVTLQNSATGSYQLAADNGIAVGNGSDNVVNAGTLTKTAGTGTSTISVPFSNTGTVQASSGTLAPTNVAQVSGGTLTGGTWDVNANATLNLNNGTNLTTIGNSASVTLDGTGSTFSNLSRVAANNGRLTLSSAATLTTTANFVNSGTLSLSPGLLSVQGTFTQFGIAGPAVLNIGIGGSTAGSGYGQVQATGSLSLSGTLTSTLINGFSLSLTSNQQFMVAASPAGRGGTFGSVNAPTSNGATLSPWYNFNATDGYNVRLNTVAIGTSIFWVNAGSDSDWNTGANWNTGIVPVSSDNVFISTFNGVTITHNAASSDTFNQLTSYTPLSIGGGTLTIGATSTLNAATTLAGGTLNLNGSVAMPGGFTFTGGTFGGSATYTSAGPWTLSGSAPKTISTPIINASTLTISGTGSLTFTGSGSVTNQAGATIDWQTTASLTGTGTFVNQGTFERTTSAGTATIGVPFTNAGLVEIMSGTAVAFNGGYTQTGGTLDLQHGNISSASTVQIQGGVVEDTGTINASVNQTGGTMAPGPDPGIITINGDWTLNAGSTVNIEIDGTNPAVPDFDQVIITGTATLAGTLNVTEGGGFTAGANQSFQIIAAAALAGTFDTITGLQPASGYWFRPNYSGTALMLTTYLPTFIVTTTSDAGAGSLRQAIGDADAHAGKSTIVFSIPGGGVQTIALRSGLPRITAPVTLDGTTQPGFTTTPIIVLDGTSAGGASGLTVGSGGGGSTILGLVIDDFTQDGILVEDNGVTVVGNYIGIDATGTTAEPNALEGIEVESSNDTIGGTTPGSGNVLSGNGFYGLRINGTAGAIDNTVEGNYIGTNAAGAGAVANSRVGIYIQGSAGNTIGGLTSTPGTGAGNVISGNGGVGLGINLNLVLGSRANVVEGNVIGLDATGSTALTSATGVGIQIANGPTNNTIGGTTASARNIIAGNGTGVLLTSATGTGAQAVMGNTIEGNYIGTNRAGSLAVANTTDGIRLNNAANNTVGGYFVSASGAVGS
jgi:hypothetical protein